MNWYILIPVGIALIALVIFLVIRNQKDEKKFERQMNNEPEDVRENKNGFDKEEVIN